MNTLYKHAHLIIDDHKECLDGALLINDEYIKEVYINSNNINEDDTRVIDVKGNIIMPDFFSGKENKVIIDPLNINKIENKKILIGNTKAYDKDIKDLEYDGIYDLYHNMTGFDANKLGIVNTAFNNLDKYVFIDTSNIDLSVLKFTLNNLRKDRIILINKEEGIKTLKKLNINNTDILAMSSLNEYRFYEEDKLDGSLIKGKHSKILILDEEMNILNKENF